MKITILGLTLLFSPVTFAQNVNTLKADLAICNANGQKLQAENDYLRKSINVLKPIKTLEQDDFEVRLLKCDGNIKEQTITVTLALTSHKANSEFQFSSGQIIDLQGKDFKTYERYLGKEKDRNKLYTDTPLEATLRFSQVLPSIKILKLFSVGYYSVGLFKEGSFEFKDIDINWK